MNVVKISVAAMTLPLFVGCASIVSGSNQTISLETKAENGMNVGGANCKLTNNKGTWFVTSPGSATVNRSFEALDVKCDHKDHQTGTAIVQSSTKAMAFGNVLFGGPIGAGVDMATGAAYDYPNLISVTMGKSVAVGTPPPVPPAGLEEKK